MLMIKRYHNRKLYSTTHKSYVTLLELGGQIQKGEEIFVTDETTKTNITPLVLSQILTEQIKKLPYSSEPNSSQGQVLDAKRVELTTTLHAVLRSIPPRQSGVNPILAKEDILT